VLLFSVEEEVRRPEARRAASVFWVLHGEGQASFYHFFGKYPKGKHHLVGRLDLFVVLLR